MVPIYGYQWEFGTSMVPKKIQPQLPPPNAGFLPPRLPRLPLRPPRHPGLVGSEVEVMAQ